MKINSRYLFTISLASAMGGLLFGYDWVVIGGAKPFYESFFNIAGQSALQGWAMSSALVGCLLGAVFSGFLSDRYGRKRLLILAAFLFIISAVGTGASNHFNTFVFFRILGGVGIGLASNLSPMYIAEISPASIRGKFVSLNQLTIVIGILAAQIANWLIADPVPAGADWRFIMTSWNGMTGWRVMFWAEVVPATLFFVFMFLVPESPRWLLKANREEPAVRVLSRVGGRDYALAETQRIRQSLTGVTTRIPWRQLLRPGVRAMLLIGVVLAVFQQWSGINVIFNYAQEVFSAAGYEISDTLFNIVITGSVNLIFTFIALFTVDRWGRRVLMLVGAGGLALIYLFLGAGYFIHVTGWPMLLLVIAAIACYAMTLAPVTWVILSEIFPNRIRGAALAIATFFLWSGCFILTYTFPILNHLLKTSGTFWIYGAICVAGFLFVLFKLPETKGKSLEKIEQEMTGNVTKNL
ncbi:MAG: sugar porter family MFS transporter [Bacteroidales bacterium]|nr:sugar porter family MFS transporter [Bacteroidales bacterium]